MKAASENPALLFAPWSSSILIWINWVVTLENEKVSIGWVLPLGDGACNVVITARVKATRLFASPVDYPVFLRILSTIVKTIVNNKGTRLQINTVKKRFNSKNWFNVNKYANTVKEKYTTKSILRRLVFLTRKKTINETYIIEPTCIENRNSVSPSLAWVGKGIKESIKTPIFCKVQDLHFGYDDKYDFSVLICDTV